MSAAILDMWAGTWWSLGLPSPSDPIKDINGVPLTVGTVVKFVCVITEINVNDPHFGTIKVQPLHPGTWPNTPVHTRSNPQSPNFITPNPQEPQFIYGFEAIQLVAGS